VPKKKSPLRINRFLTTGGRREKVVGRYMFS
jgi:hypothetical protein